MENIFPLIGNQFPKRVIPEITKAKNSIDFIVYDWRWYPDDIGSEIQQFNFSLVRAVKRGVKVRALLNKDLVGQIPKEEGIEVKIKSLERMVHTKLMVIDNQISILGSHNYTKQAFETNLEFSVMIINENFVKRCKEYFENLWQ